MKHSLDDIALNLLGRPYDELDEHAKRAATHVAQRTHLSLGNEGAAPTTGQRAADAVARFGGSWAFIGIFATCLIAWVLLNSLLLGGHGSAFDPYPYILLNLFLSMLAAVQAPIILMSQNRQAQRGCY